MRKGGRPCDDKGSGGRASPTGLPPNANVECYFLPSLAERKERARSKETVDLN